MFFFFFSFLFFNAKSQRGKGGRGAIGMAGAHRRLGRALAIPVALYAFSPLCPSR
ncbi:MAG: hypothetical protein KC619_06905 [Myxococcales bacterium]|nr:hypothetical protein [Myxococcales bacterium]